MIYFGRLKGLSQEEARTFSMNYLERVGLSDKAKTRLDKLSGGQQQKIQLGVTIMGAALAACHGRSCAANARAAI